MCGIVGIWGPGAAHQTESVRSMAHLLAHRGPDESGFSEADRFCGGTVRLAIQDPEHGQQPMRTPDDRLVIHFNGEIYNHLELRRTHLAGTEFRTHCDTETLLRLWERMGSDCLPHLDGQFAFVVHDRATGRLCGARDRWGICPLHFARLPGGLWFVGSELKPLAARSDFAFRLRGSAIALQAFSWSTNPPDSIWQDCLELPPSHSFVLDPGTDAPKTSPYFRFSDWTGSGPSDLPDGIEQVRDLLERTVRSHMLSDVPVASYLSGGIDSTVVAALARRHSPDGLKTFSVTFDDGDFDESAGQDEASAFLGVRHTSIRVGRSDIRSGFSRAVASAERPLFRNAPVPLMLLARKVKESGIRVVLTGEGSDEVFWGYDTFKEARIRALWARHPDSRWRGSLLRQLYAYLPQFKDPRAMAFLDSFYRRTLESTSPVYPLLPRIDKGAAAQNLLSPEHRLDFATAESVLGAMLPECATESDPLRRNQIAEMRTFLPGYLLSTQGDRVQMANSVEGRFPFLSNELGRTLWNLPTSWKLRGLTEKFILREASRGLVPESVRTAPKFPYRAPDAQAFFPDLPGWAEELLQPHSLESTGIFSVPETTALVAKLRRLRPGQTPSQADSFQFLWVLSTQVLDAVYRRGVHLDDLQEPNHHG